MLQLVYSLLVYKKSNVTATPSINVILLPLADFKNFNWRTRNRLILPCRGNKEYSHLNCILYKAKWLTKKLSSKEPYEILICLNH